MRLFDIAREEGRVLYASAPMVRYSKVCVVWFLFSFAFWGFLW